MKWNKLICDVKPLSAGLVYFQDTNLVIIGPPDALATMGARPSVNILMTTKYSFAD